MSAINPERFRRRAVPLLVGSLLTALTLALPGRADAAVIVPDPAVGRIASTNPDDLTPDAKDGEVRAFAQLGNVVYVGGSFTQVRTAAVATWISRPYVLAYDRTTGALISTFQPVLDDAVNALLVTPDGKLVIGGAFKTVNGVSRKNLVEVDPATGATIAGWSGRSDGGNIKAMRQFGGQIYLAGAFNWIDGVAHHGMARIDEATGAIDPSFVVDATDGRNNVAAYVWTIDITPDGRTLAMGGNFQTVNGEPRNQIALIDLDAAGNPTVADWSTQRYVPPCAAPATFTHYVQDIDFSDDGSYFIVGSNGGGGWPTAYCDTLARWDTNVRGDNLSATWVDLTGNDTITSVLATDNVIYLGGHFRWLNNPNGSDVNGAGAIDRLGIAATDPNNGMPLNWNPRRSGAPPGTTAWDSAVPAIWKGSDGVYFGQNSDGLGGEYHGRFGMFPFSGARTIPVIDASKATSGYLYLGGSTAGQLSKIPFDGTSLGTAATIAEPNMTSSTGVAMRAADKLFWDTGGQFGFSSVAGDGTVGAPWYVGYNTWYNPSTMSGAFFLAGRMYYTKAGSSSLFYRYVEPDGYTVGASEFTLPTTGLDWSTVRGLTWVNGAIVYGSMDGSLRSVPFDATAANGNAVDGSQSVVLAANAGFTSKTLYFSPN